MIVPPDRYASLELEADTIIHDDARARGTYAGLEGIVTDWNRYRGRFAREVLVADPDPSTALGMFGRVRNPTMPWLNSRDGIASHLRRPGRSPMSAYVQEYGLPQTGGEGMGCTGFHSGAAANCSRHCRSQ